MPDSISELAGRLARDAEAVCRHYLSKGRREGRYWLVGDVDNTPGAQSLRSPERDRLRRGRGGQVDRCGDGSARRPARPDRRHARHLTTWRDTLDEARRFLSLPPPDVLERPALGKPAPGRIAASRAAVVGDVATDPGHARRNLSAQFAGSRIYGMARTCVFTRAATIGRTPHRLRTRRSWPALIAAVTDLEGGITGVHRTWLAPTGHAKAPVSTPRRALGSLSMATACGSARWATSWRLARASRRSCRCDARCPPCPMVAALSANHLAALILPPGLRRLYIARDNDDAGRWATETLTERAHVPTGSRLSC